MNKRHLFRGFAPDSPYVTQNGKDVIRIGGRTVYGTWIYGYLFNANTINVYKVEEFDGIPIEIFVERKRVFPSTVTQWVTTDNNGADVYEGDLGRLLGDDELYEVVFMPNECRWVIRDKYGDTLLIDDYVFEVVGNIWESEVNND